MLVVVCSRCYPSIPLCLSLCLSLCYIFQSEPETLWGWPAAGGTGDGGPAAAAQPPAAAAPHRCWHRQVRNHLFVRAYCWNMVLSFGHIFCTSSQVGVSFLPCYTNSTLSYLTLYDLLCQDVSFLQQTKYSLVHKSGSYQAKDLALNQDHSLKPQDIIWPCN